MTTQPGTMNRLEQLAKLREHRLALSKALAQLGEVAPAGERNRALHQLADIEKAITWWETATATEGARE